MKRTLTCFGMLLTLMSIKDSPAIANEVITYTYDALGRLVAVSTSGSVNNGQSVTTSFDPAGNRTNYSVSGASGGGGGASASLSIGNASVTEGGSLSFTVTRSGNTATAVNANYATAGGTATSGSDFAAASGTVSFAAGETGKTITVATIDDTATESAETMSVSLSSPTGGATITTSTGTGSILDNDTVITIADNYLNVLAAHQSTYGCYDLYIPEYGIDQQSCWLTSNSVTVYQGYSFVTSTLDPGYSMPTVPVLKVLPAYYGTGVAP